MKQVSDEQIFEALCQCDIPMRKGVAHATIPELRALFWRLNATLTATQQAAPSQGELTRADAIRMAKDAGFMLVSSHPSDDAVYECFPEEIERLIQASYAAGAASAQREQPAASKPPTMNDLYGDGSDHPVCAICEMCLKCGDCRCDAESAASKPQPQAQAGKPEVVAMRYKMQGDLQWQYTTRKEQTTHAHLVDELITLQSHREAMAAVQNAYFKLSCDFAELQTAIAKKDAALVVCVEALDQYSKGTVTLRNKVGGFRICCGTPELTSDHSHDCKAIAAIQQAQGALK